MVRWKHLLKWVWCLTACTSIGCHAGRDAFYVDPLPDQPISPSATELELPTVASERSVDSLTPAAPRTLAEAETTEYWDLSLQDAIRIALSNSRVMRDVGARIVNQPPSSQLSNTVYDAAIAEADPVRGPHAALSEFDAQFATKFIYNHANVNDDNNRARAHHFPFMTLGSATLADDFYMAQLELSKKAATGTQYAVRSTNYYLEGDFFARTAHLYNPGVELEVRHPLLQGGGIDFNRIAGPRSVPGIYNGVVLARLNTDIALADFELAVTNFLVDVERAYWNLHYAYRDLNAKKSSRDASLEIWRTVKRKYEAGAEMVDADDEASARGQYYLLQGEVEDSLAGRETLANVALPTTGGVYANERRLRVLMGLPANDGRLIRATDSPVQAPVTFEWIASCGEAIDRRVQLRKQRWIVKRRELELVASRNFLLPKLDLLANYRTSWLDSQLVTPDNNPIHVHFGLNRLDLEGDMHQASAGLQFSAPLGWRKELAAVRHAELTLARERAVLREQELQISHELSASITELDRAYHQISATYNRFVSAQQQVAARRAKYDKGALQLEFLLDAQLRSAESDSIYHKSLVDYNLALTNVHLQRGSLLEYNGVIMAEGQWPEAAYADALKQTSRWRELEQDRVKRSSTVSQGPYPQVWEPETETVVGEATEVLPNESPSSSEPGTEEALPAPNRTEPSSGGKSPTEANEVAPVSYQAETPADGVALRPLTADDPPLRRLPTTP